MQSPVVLYEDNHLLALVKASGQLVQADASGDGTLLDVAKAYIKEKYQKPGNVWLAPVHRLDRPTSGVILFARTDKAASRLADQFRRRTPQKVYRAVVRGVLPAAEGELVHRLVPGAGQGQPTRLAEGGERGGKEARLRYRCVSRGDRCSEVEIELLTGLKHQIRAQFAAIGCPLVGDFKYDHCQNRGEIERLDDGHAIALHALRLEVEHPTKRVPLVFEAPLPSYWPVV